MNLGLPKTMGTSIVINQSITSGQAAQSSASSTTPTQDSVVFNVAGRLNTFQANAIQGDTDFPSSGFQNGGGTLVVSQTDTATAITGQIGFVRIGGNATNFATQTNDKISNFYIGGETNNVALLAPNGSRAIEFGKGMDTVTILTHYIDSLQANRGALNSNVTVDRNVGRVTIGGDVQNTQFLAGYQQGLASIFQTQTAPTTAPNAQDGGAIDNVLIAGSVTNSVFAASVDPDQGTFGTANDLVLPHGHIEAKVEGTIDNSAATNTATNDAFFGKLVKINKGAVLPPNVPELPFKGAGGPPTGPRIVPGLMPTYGNGANLFPSGQPSGTITGGPSPVRPVATSATASPTKGRGATVAIASAKQHTKATPKGPAHAKKKA